MILVLIFYYIKSAKKQFLLVLASVCMVEMTVFTVVILNNAYHLWNYNWKWYEYLYFFGFVLAIPLLQLYNGEKGEYPFGRYFFFLYYPAHFMVLYAIKMLIAGEIHQLYLMIHVICLLCAVCITILVYKQVPSDASEACLILGLSAAIYTFGFILEILTSDLSFAYAGVIIEYFGECLVFVSFLRFISIFCKFRISRLVYGISGIFSAVIMFLICTTGTTGLFYSDMSIDYDGLFPRIHLEYSWGFYIFIFYMVSLCGISFVICLKTLIKSKGIEKRRVANVMVAIMCPWVAFILLQSGITGGFEVSVIGVLGSLYLIYRAIVKYGYFNSIQLAEANALYHFREGILVVDCDNRITYINERFSHYFPLRKEMRINNPVILKMISGEINKYEIEENIYDVERIPLLEKGFTQGYMICLHDMTDHYMRLQEAEHFAHTDGLTGLFNRNYFKECYIEYRKTGGLGTLMMFDLDNFKGVNDKYGHDIGDIVLKTLAETLNVFSLGKHLTCRIGGDEYVMFLKNIIDSEEISKICQGLINDFANRLEDKDLKGITSISIGATRITEVNLDSNEESFTENYKLADSALYVAKTSGKATFRIQN